MVISQLLGFFVVLCSKAKFSSTLFAQALSEDSTLFSVALPEFLVVSSAAAA